MIFYFITFGFVCDSIILLSKFVTNIAFTDYSAFLFQKSVTSHHFYGLSHGFLLKIRNIPAMLYNAIEYTTTVLSHAMSYVIMSVNELLSQLIFSDLHSKIKESISRSRITTQHNIIQSER